jgi:hypothetical protein
MSSQPSSDLLFHDELAAHLPSAVADVTEQTFFACADRCDRRRLDELLGSDGTLADAAAWIRAEVSFRGTVNGALRIVMPRVLARELGAAMIGHADVNAMTDALVQDTAGELANIVCGAVLSQSERHHIVELLPPVISQPAQMVGTENYSDDVLFDVNEKPLIVQLVTASSWAHAS